MRFSFFLKEGKKYLQIIFVILFCFLQFVSADILTSLDIPNSPPFLIKDIPNQSWPENQNHLNAFDLDDYFSDADSPNLSYYNSSVEDIYVFIDPLTNEVSFFPREGFTGTRNVTFYASDSIYDTLSNVVMLYVGLDSSPPNWSSPNISKQTVYQNDIITFVTNWTDDRGLGRYIFSINQGAGWENYSSTNFSGLENVSFRNIQIRAPPLNTVYWRFYAFDTSENMNLTPIQSFVVSTQQIPGGYSGGGGSSGDSGKDPSRLVDRILSKIEIQKRKSENFQLSISELRVSLKQGSSKTRVLKITNTGLEEIPILLSSRKINNFTIFSETNITILPGKSKEITIDFYAPERTIPGQYFGYIDVKSPKVNRSIPTVLDVQAIDLEFDLILNLSEGYSLVKPGKNIKFNISLFNIKDLKEVNASLYYAIKDYEGKVYNFSEEEIVFFYNVFLERELQVPSLTPEGNYLIYARASDEKNIAIDSVPFEVGTRFNFASFFKIGSISFLILLVAILLAILMVKHKRDKKKERLLELYIMLNRLKSLIKQNKEDEALKLFIKIKDIYREPIPKEVFDDRERLKKEISDLYNSFTKDSKEIPKVNTSEKKEIKEPKEPKELKEEQNKQKKDTNIQKGRTEK
ncbi:MAG TPA: hypothetical protein PLE51_00625 [Candidatus Pacearchaeota archaeon]|nr:hypothetical protein [Candidatus Pacearchaeota archaeon]HOU78976.1 hypothetical protein [Candidatus Pacearchaeota archaeon]HQF82600.1 hypothetical protein [Candidatus Pacearchaeota archaeon]HQI58033.1 hypothetical protein [Candidatus Pacearchaeota archaeon]HQJ58086.1 hypothetical protein [Candidatus Pacearchaeota archaeon]